MDNISFASIFFLLATLSSLSSTFPIKPRAVSDLEADLTKLSGDLVILASSIDSIASGLDVVDGTVTIVDITFVEADLIKCNADTSTISGFSVDEAKDIIDIANGVVSNFKAVLSAAVEQKSTTELLIAPALIVPLEFGILGKLTIKLANSLIALVPPDDCDLVKEATDIRDQLQAAFKAMIDAYAG